MGKQRPKFSRAGQFVKTYTPKDTINYEQWVKTCYIQAGGKHYKDQPIKISIDIYYKIPKAFSKKKRQQALDGIIVPTVRPDLDNCSKTILDALNNIAYDDDKQVVELHVRKLYALEPKVIVEIKTL